VSVEVLTIILFASTFALLAIGLPIAFALGSIAVVFAAIFWGVDKLYILAVSGYSNLQNVNLVAIPLFILMGWILYKSGIADDLFDAIHVWAGGIKGGLAMGTIVVATIFAAVCGDMLAAIFTITTVSLGPLLKRGYDKHLAIGSVMAGALLGLIIPPSIIIIVFSSATGQSIGRMYLGCFIPGLILAGLYIAYIAIRCHLKPELGPTAPPETRAGWGVKLAKSKGVIAPVALLLSMLIGIYSGAISPMEASAIGVAGALICAALKRRLSLKVLWEAVFMTLKVTCMIGFLFLAIGCFSAVYAGIGARDLAGNIAARFPGGGIAVIIVMQFSLIIFGMFMDDLAIIMIFGPIFLTAVKSIGFDSIWYGVLFMVNMQIAFLTPPYGFGLFTMKAAINSLPEPFDVSMGDIYRSALPFIGLQVIGLILIMLFEPLATFLPNLFI